VECSQRSLPEDSSVYGEAWLVLEEVWARLNQQLKRNFITSVEHEARSLFEGSINLNDLGVSEPWNDFLTVAIDRALGGPSGSLGTVVATLVGAGLRSFANEKYPGWQARPLVIVPAALQPHLADHVR